jgi:hypothetical protein
LTFAPGVTQKKIVVSLLNCHQSLASGFETFYLTLASNTGPSTIYRSQTQVDIVGDAATTSTPALSVVDRVVDATAGTIQVPVVLGGPSGATEDKAVSVPYTTHDGTAVAGADYTNESGKLKFPKGVTAENISVPILDRSGSAAARSFSVTLGTPTNATVAKGTAVVTIGASGAAKVAQPSISAPPDTVVGDYAGYLELPVTLSAPAVGTVTVGYQTYGITADGGHAGCYYNPPTSAYANVAGTLTFVSGVTTGVVRVPILSCGQSGPLTFLFQLYNNTGSTITRAQSTETVSAGDKTPPTTSVVMPSTGAALKGTEVLAASASDNVSVNNVQFAVTGGPLTKSVVGLAAPSIYGYLYEWNTTTVPNGTYTLQSVATDEAGNTASSAAIAVKVNN